MNNNRRRTELKKKGKLLQRLKPSVLTAWEGHRVQRASGQAAVGQAKTVPLGLCYLRQTGATAAPPDETIEMLIVKHNGALHGFNEWTLNGQAFSMKTMTPKLTVHEGKRYRFKFRNASDEWNFVLLETNDLQKRLVARLGMVCLQVSNSSRQSKGVQ